MGNKTKDGNKEMSQQTIPCANSCICLPMCINKSMHDIFDCCKLLSSHWYKWVGHPQVHRKLAMKRGYNLVSQMNKILKRTFIPYIYHERIKTSGKTINKEVRIFADALEVQHMPAKDLFYTIREYDKIGINLFADKYVGEIIIRAFDHHYSKEATNE